MIILIKYKIYSTDLIHLEIGKGFFKEWPNPPNDLSNEHIMKVD